jgi:hypothetical protein
MPNFAALEGIHCMGGVSGLMHRRYGELCHTLDPELLNMKDPRFVGALTDPDRLPSRLLDLLGVRYLAVGDMESYHMLQGKGYMPVFRSDEEGTALLMNRSALPRAYLRRRPLS